MERCTMEDGHKGRHVWESFQRIQQLTRGCESVIAMLQIDTISYDSRVERAKTLLTGLLMGAREEDLTPLR